MEIRALYNLAKQQNIEVLQFSLKDNGSISMMSENGSCYIGMDESVRDGAAQERVHLGHELGHCMTGSFYSIHTAVDSRQRHENKADKWAVQKLIPLEDLDAAISHGYTQTWELAEYFGVTETFIKKAVCYYTHGNLATDIYF